MARINTVLAGAVRRVCIRPEADEQKEQEGGEGGELLRTGKECQSW